MKLAVPVAQAARSRPDAWLRACWPAALFSTLLALYLLPVIVLGQDSPYIIHDNLDSEISIRAVAARAGHAWRPAGSEVVPQMMGSLPRAFLSSGYQFVYLLFAIFPPFTAYLLNHIVVHVTAFAGMVLLARRWLTPMEEHRAGSSGWVHWGVALAFAVLPIYTIYGLAMAGLPLLAYVFLHIARGEARPWHYLALALFPFASHFLYNGPQILAAMVLALLIDTARRKRIRWAAWAAFGGFALLSVLVEWDLLRATLTGSAGVSHRAAWNLAYTHAPLAQAARNAVDLFLRGQYHAPSHHAPALLAACLALALSIGRWSAAARAIVWLIAAQVFIAAFYGLYFWDGIIPLKQQFGSLGSFNLARLHWLAPPAWYAVLGLSLLVLAREPRLGRAVRAGLVAALLVAQVAWNLSYNANYGHWASRWVQPPGFRNEGLTYRQFFAERQFARVRDAIGRPQDSYRVASLGIHPAIALYNRFSTVDGYHNSYPLAYKLAFRQIIAPELELSPSYRAYFDSWGSRAYLFSHELPDALSTKEQGRVVRNLAIDTAAFARLGGRYLISAVEVTNHAELGLAARGVFEDPQSAWTIYLYEVEPAFIE